MRCALRGAMSARTSSAVARSRLSILRERSVSTRSFSSPNASNSSRTARTRGSIISRYTLLIHPLIHPGAAIRFLLAHVHFELLLGAIQLPRFVGIAQRSRHVDVHCRASPVLGLQRVWHLQENIAEEHAAQMRDVAYRAAGIERIQERDGPDDHHEIFHFDGNQEAE